MPIRLLKYSVYACVVLFAAKSIGYTNTYRLSPSVSQNDFSQEHLERWQIRSKNIVSIDHGHWYLSLMGGNTRVTYLDFRNVEQSLSFDTDGLEWKDCNGNLTFEPKNARLKSDIDTGCINKKTFQKNVSTLISASVQRVKNHQLKAMEAFEIQEKNKRSWL